MHNLITLQLSTGECVVIDPAHIVAIKEASNNTTHVSVWDGKSIDAYIYTLNGKISDNFNITKKE